MLKGFNIQLIEKIEKAKTENSFLNGLLTIALVIVSPIIFLCGLIIMAFVSIFSIGQRFLITSHKTIDKERTEQSQKLWTVFTKKNNLTIFQQVKGEIRFGPVYINLKADPIIDFLKDKIFGDWFFYYDKGIFLQQWNLIDKADTKLIFINIATLEIKILKDNIPSVNWNIMTTKDNELQLTCDTENEKLIYNIEPNIA